MKEGFDNYRNRRELATFLGVSYDTIDRWIAAGKVPPPDHVTEQGMKLWSPDTVTALYRSLKDKKDKFQGPILSER